MSAVARAAAWLYGLCLPPDDQAALGDLLEEHAERQMSTGRTSSDWWLWRQVFRSIIPSLLAAPARTGWRRPIAAFVTGVVVFYGLGALVLLAISALNAETVERAATFPLFATYTALSVGAAYAAGRSVAAIAGAAASLVACALCVLVLTPEIIGLVTGRRSEGLGYRLVWETLIPITLLVAARRGVATTIHDRAA